MRTGINWWCTAYVRCVYGCLAKGYYEFLLTYFKDIPNAHLPTAAAVAEVNKANNAACAESGVEVAVTGEAEGGGAGAVDVLTVGGVGCFFLGSAVVVVFVFDDTCLISDPWTNLYFSLTSRLHVR